MHKQHVVHLTESERAALLDRVSRGTAPARLLTHARVLLHADSGPAGPAWSDDAIVEAVHVSRPTIERVRKRFASEGLEAALARRAPRASKPRKLDGDQEAHLIALACSPPPAGAATWSLRLLADKIVALTVVEAISYETIRRTLKKTSSSRG